MAESIEAIIQRVLGNDLSPEKLQDLVTAIKSGNATLATGDRALALGGSADDAVMVTGDQNITGNRNIIFQGADAEAIRKLLEPSFVGIPDNLPRSGVVQFVGRETELEELHQQMQDDQQASVFAITGMGGVGKTELALQYAFTYKPIYQAGVCWLQTKGVDIGTQIVQFARSRLQLNPSEELGLLEQVGFCWSHWPEGLVLVILDDINNYEVVKEYLPPADPRFKVLLTTRLRLGLSVKKIEIDVLSESKALVLLESLIGLERVRQEQDWAKKIYQWLGGLPLGLELVGRYLNLKEDLSLAKMHERLESKRLEARAVTKGKDTEMTAKLGVADAFELSWSMLPEPAKELAYLMSSFAQAPIPWKLVEACLSEEEEEDLEDCRDEHLLSLHLIQRKDKSVYQLHQLIREFLHNKTNEVERSKELKQRLCNQMVQIADYIPESPTRTLLVEFEPAMPHVAEVALNLNTYLEDDEIIKPFKGLSRFYDGQGFYSQKQEWWSKGLEVTRNRFNAEHAAIATCLSGLASSHRARGQYTKAQPLHEQAYAMRRNLFGEKHPDVADSLNNLGLLMKAQGQYEQAESFYTKALEMRQQLFGEEHADVADSLNNLALLYNAQGRYNEAEPLFKQALEIRQRVLGEDHPRVATSYNNLAYCYSLQKKYAEAEPLYIRARGMYNALLGEKHPDVAAVSNNLAEVYVNQERYADAEVLFNEALSINMEILGKEHPHVATGLDNLASVYDEQGRADEAEPLYIKSLDMRKKLLGEKHPHVAISLNNFAKFYQLQKRFDKAESLFRQSIAILEEALSETHPITQKVRSNFESMQEERDGL